MDPHKLSSPAQKFFELIEFDPNEQLICEIRKHPFGLFLIYFGGGFVTLAIFSLLVAGSLFIEGDPLGLGLAIGIASPIIIVVGIILTGVSIVATLVGAHLYRANVVLVTSEKIAQVLYTSIFNRKISQLSIGDIQDVTVAQNGILARFLNYGTLVIETAGEQQNYTFTYTPFPYQCAKDIVGAHEANVALHGN